MSVELNELVEVYGEGALLAFGGAIIGVCFGFFAQRSKFCLRAAVIDFGTGISKTNFLFGCWLFLRQSLAHRPWFYGADWTAVGLGKSLHVAVCRVPLSVACCLALA